MANSNFLREFQFLPDLPKANLDDRSFDDLVQECKLRIPRYCQEWTNHNPSDPGITLIELFAWLTDQMLLRFNQVPRLNYVAFLELLGIRLQPPTAAQSLLTFYLTKPVIAGEGAIAQVPKGTEVATMRTETEPAVVFTTDDELIVGKAQLKGLFTARHPEPSALSDSELTQPRGPNPDWQALGQVRLFETTEVGNCFYLVLVPEQSETDEQYQRGTGGGLGNHINTMPAASGRNSIIGNVIDLNFAGVVAGSTGIDPNDPPLIWEVWTGKKWASGILRTPNDDRTKGFSFHELQQQGAHTRQGSDVRLHLPHQWPEEDFGTGCRGHWIRCVYRQSRDSQAYYSYSPLIDRITIQSVGGSIQASECVTVKQEFIGISNGKPGQRFQLEGFPILARNPEMEYVVVKYPNGFPASAMGANPADELALDDADSLGERWVEVSDFGDSSLDEAISTSLNSSQSGEHQVRDGQESPISAEIHRSLQQADAAKRHYTLDSQSGTLQFGPLVREPSQLQYQTLERTQRQPWGKEIQQFSTRIDVDKQLIAADDSAQIQRREWQYGQVPPRGAELYMSAYRVGGGSRGNVKAETLVKLKTAVPYVKSVINYAPATGGKDAESLDEAVLRVPQVLRTAKAAMIPEDFEVIGNSAHADLHRVHCLPCPSPGVARLLAIAAPSEWHQTSPAHLDAKTQAANFARTYPNGLAPSHYGLTDAIETAVHETFQDRKPLGVKLRLEQATFVGVQVVADVLLNSAYVASDLRETLMARIKTHLYRYLNPLVGGAEGSGWDLGRSLSHSDVIAQLQSLPEIQYVGPVRLFAIRYHSYDGWFRSEHAAEVIEPGPQGVLCSWDDDDLQSGHIIHFMR